LWKQDGSQVPARSADSTDAAKHSDDRAGGGAARRRGPSAVEDSDQGSCEPPPHSLPIFKKLDEFRH